MKAIILTVVIGASLRALAQAPDADLFRYISSIKAIDNHSHVPALDRQHDKGYDQLRCDDLESPNMPDPANVRFGPMQQDLYKTLYGFEPQAGSEGEMKHISQLQAAARDQYGPGLYQHILETAGIEMVLANRTTVAPELPRSLFRWVPYMDALLFPLDNRAQKELNPDRRIFFGDSEDLLKTYLSDVGLVRIPATLDAYVQHVVRATIQKQRAAGAVAVKFEAAYLRSLDFRAASRDDASRVYEKYATSGSASAGDYKTLQDYLFKEIAMEAGRLGMAVHIHTGFGCGSYFDDAGADAMLLSPVLNDPDLRKTNFVLLHGNHPRERNISVLILKPNVYADMSVLEFYLSPADLARVLRSWLEAMPEHVMFGTDAGTISPELRWEETTVLGAQNMRRALALALSEMVQDGTVPATRARDIANAVLRGNAARLYGLN